MIDTLARNGLVSEKAAKRMRYVYVKGGKIKIPATVALACSASEEVYFKDLSDMEKREQAKKLQAKVKNGTITKNQYRAYLSGEIPISISNYIVGDYRSLSPEQRDKVDAAMNKRSKAAAIRSVKVK